MNDSTLDELDATLDEICDAGLWKVENPLDSPQGGHIVSHGEQLVNFCSNNYLGLADHSAVVAAAKHSLDRWGFGMASVRFISGTQSQHLDLEAALTDFLGTEASVLFPSCFDANGAVFETLLDDRDAVISDELNHASIIDGIRLSKAARHRYHNRDMADLELKLQATAGARRRLIVTDGVFSMDGYVAPLDEIVALARRYDAMVMVDDSHAAGFVGRRGAGTPELFGVTDDVDILTGTLGKALGGASGGYVSGRSPVVELLRQRGRPYLFSNSVPPVVVAGSLAALEIVTSPDGDARRAQLAANAARLREGLTGLGFELLPGAHPIIPVMIPEAPEAASLATALRRQGVAVTAFVYPVVPLGRSRIRVQVSAAHTEEDIAICLGAFAGALV
ncbi:glycine C-acetyltransferase [Herbiconiux sp. VKM Ac-1786]|uniref:glycine C-acetyltransferase n=1 Tax=Herbiconiux sp. VKM Ac-1786 TaxID=2783824 RepID=UPI00188B8651|nr:glycine C-acetyltransferase [Herbiconiux sp. VKM Ac-1786]